MDSSALVSIENAVSDFLLGYKKDNSDYIVYLRHACVLLQDYMVHDSTEATVEKVSVSALGIMEIPDYFIRIKDICVAKNGEWWPMTESKNKVNTTTFTLGVEGQDSAFGEGVNVQENLTSSLAAKGAVNEYYYTIDWKARRAFIDGMISDTALIRGVTSGIVVSGTTYMPVMLIPMLDNYLLYKETFWIKELKAERVIREKTFDNERLKIRNVLNSLSASQWQDIFWGSFSQNPKR
jgi:hypothetical protein